MCVITFTYALGVAVEDWFDIPLPMEGIKSTSVIFNEVSNLLSEPYACFCGEDENDCHLELYPRNNGKCLHFSVILSCYIV